MGGAEISREQKGGDLLADYSFALPDELIARYPTDRRTDSRLLVLDRQVEAIRHEAFPAITHYLSPGDLLVLNDTRVLPARLFGEKASGGRLEALLVRRLEGVEEDWWCLVKSSRTPRIGSRIRFSDDLEAEVLKGEDPPQRLLRFHCRGDLLQRLETIGELPLPPYFQRRAEEIDRERYQTVFARQPGAVAAPTAGLHFTTELLDDLRHAGVEIVPLTLHVGIGTFLPVRVEHLSEHQMHFEHFEVPAATALAVNRAKREGRRVVALGTTVTRTLEAAVGSEGELQAGAGQTDLFIRPGYRFRLVDALVTNFHLPQSTLLVLVAAFAGRERMFKAYAEAVEKRYRFFSYGDAMLIG